MSADFEAPNGGSEQETPLDERIATAEALAYGRHGYMTEAGEFDHAAVADAMTALVRGAEAAKKSDRAKVCITRREIMRAVFPKVPGPEDWADQSDPEMAEGVYKRLDGTCWRYTAMSPSGQIQSRFNSDVGLVVVRTKVNPHKTDAVYCTRDLGCLLEDAIKPQRAAEKKRADRDAAFVAMLIERVPEHGKRFNRELVGGLKVALESAQAITAAVLEASTIVDDDTDVDDDE